LREWYKKLNIDEDKVFKVNKEKISFNELLDLIKSNRIGQQELFEPISHYLSEFLAREGKFLEVALKN